MVLESLVVSILNKVLGSYVTNLNYNQLNIGIWSGEVVLKNLQLKKEALDKFNLPVDVLEGYLGELTLSIPWSNLKSKPVKIFINNVYLLAVPREDSNITLEEEEAREQAAKQEKLSNAEMLQQKVAESTPASKVSANTTEIDDQKNQTFVNALITKVVDNLQISINNIHIRYEDALSNPAHPFAVGITLSEFSALSTDEGWQPKFIEKEGNTIHKLATLGSLAVYWNTDTQSLRGLELEEAIKTYTNLIATSTNIPDVHQYILKPVSGSGRIKLNKRFGSDMAKTDATLLFEELGFILDNDQYRDALGMADLFHAYLRKHKYRHYHPPLEVTPKSDPLAYFRFAAIAVRSEIHDRNYRYSWAAMRERRDDRKSYLDVYVKVRLGRATPDEASRFKKLEEKLSYEDIRLYRSIAAPKLRKEKAIQAEKEKQQAAEAKAHTTTGWISSWWHGGTGPAKAGNDSEVITEEQRQELYDAIDYDEDKIVPQMDFPKDTMMVSLNTELKKGSFSLKLDPHGANKDILSLVFDTVSAEVIQYPDSAKIITSLRGLTLFDNTTEGTLYKEIVHVKEETPIQSKEAELDNSTKDPFFHVIFEYKPLDNRADNAVTMKMRHLEIIYNSNTIDSVVKFFKPPEETMAGLEALIDVASDAFQGLREQTRAGLEFALEQHKRLDLKIDVDAPVIIVPESCTTRNALVLVLDAGHINVESQLVPSSTISEIKAKESKQYTEADWKQLQSLMYDKFKISLNSTQVLIGQSVEMCLQEIQNPTTGSPLNLIDKINVELLVEVSILPKATNLTQFILSGHLPLFSVNFSDRKYYAIMKIIDAIVPKPDPTEQKPLPLPEGRGSIHKETSRAMMERLGVSRSEDLVVSAPGDDEVQQPSSQEVQKAKTVRSSLNQQMLQFAFRVDKLSAMLRQADKDATKPERPLVNLVLEHFSMSFLQRPYDMTVEINLKSLNVEDLLEHGSEFKYLVTSENLGDQVKVEKSEENLVHFRYVKVDPNSPEFLSKYHGVDQVIEAQLSTLNVIITRSSILTLNNFVLTTFTGDSRITSATTPVIEGSENEESQIIVQPKPTPQSQPSTISIEAKLTSINLILNNDGVRLATGGLSHADVSILVKPTTLRVMAKLGNFSLRDDLSIDNINNSNTFRQLLTIQGEELAAFRYETFDQKQEEYPGYDQLMSLKVGSARLTFLEEPVRQLVDFGSKFGEMYVLYDKARQAAVESAVQVQQAVTKLHFEVMVSAPLIVLPGSKSPKDTVVANLGELSVSNKFIPSKPEDSKITEINQINFLLRSVRVTSNFHFPNSKQVLQIIDDVNLGFDIDMADHIQGSVRPDIVINGYLSDVQANLTQKQFEFLVDVANSMSRAFSGSDEDTDTNLSEEHGDQIVRSVQSASTGVDEDNSQSVVSAIQPPETLESTNIWTKIELTFSLNAVGMELFRGDGQQKKTLAEISLCKISLNQTYLKFKMLNDSSIKAELSIKSLTMNDTRDVKSRFREIIPPITNRGPQFLVEADISSPQPERNAVFVATVDSPKVIFTLDLVFALKDFFMSAFAAPAPTLANEKSSGGPQSMKPSVSGGASQSTKISRRKSSPPQPAQPSGGMTIAFKANVVDAEIILLANAAMTSSEAIVVSTQQLQISQQGIMALSIDKIGMFLCRMDKREESTIRFIETFDIYLSMDSRTTKPGHQITNIIIEVLPLILRLSYRDAMLIMGIVNKAVELNSHVSGEETSSTENPSNTVSGVSTSALATVGGGASSLIQAAVSSQPAPYVVMSKETMKATIQGIQVIFIGDLHELPLVDASVEQFVVNVSDWSSQLRVDTKIQTAINFFNIKNSHWEPLLEAWSFQAKVTRSTLPELTQVELFSQKRLDINITHTFLETALAFMAALNKPEEVLSRARGSVVPYLLRNRTGYSMHIWSDIEDTKDTVLQKFDNNEEMPWQFDDWKARRESIQIGRNRIGLQIDGVMWESVRDIPVDREGSTVYILRPKIQSISHRLVVQVKLTDNIKVVTFRSSLVVENRTLLPIDVGLSDTNGRVIPSTVNKIAPGEDYAVPIEAAYHNRICVRPDEGFGYSWSNQTLLWKNFTRESPIRSINCKSVNGDGPLFHFQVSGRYDKKDPLAKQYPMMALRLSAPIEIENLLPYDFNFSIVNKDTGQDFTSFLRRGGTIPLHVVEIEHLLLMKIQIDDAKEYRPSEFAIISTQPSQNLNVDDHLIITDKDDLQLKLMINNVEMPDSGGARKYSVYSPYVMINKTGLDMLFKAKSAFSSAKVAAGQSNDRRRDQKMEPYMFSYSKVDNRNRCQIKVGDSNWSNPISLEAVGSSQDVVIPSASKTEEIHIGVKVAEGSGKYKLTKVVTFTPRFIFKNNLHEDLHFREPGSNTPTLLKAGERAPLHFLRQGPEKQLTIQYPGLNNKWSAPFDIQQVGEVHIKLNKGDNGRDLIKSEILLEDATLFLIFSKEEGPWPYRIDNETDVDVIIWQQDPSYRSDSPASQISPIKKMKLETRRSMPYSWDYPAIKDKMLILSVNGKEREINFQEIGNQVPFKYPAFGAPHGHGGIMNIDVIAEGPTQVLKLSNYKQSESVFRPRRSNSVSSVTSSAASSKEGFEIMEVNTKTNFIFEVRFAGIGVSIINKRMQELIYMSLRELEVKFSDSTMYQSVRAVIKWLQIDNQLYGGLYPILLYPTIIPKDGKEQDIHPTFHFAVDLVKDDAHGVSYIKYFSVLLQEMSFEMDEDFLFVLLDFAKFNVEGWKGEDDSKLADDNLEIPEPKSTEGEAQLYFEVFHIQPAKLNISFVRTARVNATDEKPHSAGPLMFFFNILTMAIGNINDAPVKLNALAMENVRVSQNVLLERVARHYAGQFMFQIYNILGSADFLGNPVGLFNNLSSGVADVFYEPYQGVIMSDRPQDLGIGIARGVGSLVKKSVFGFSDSLSKISGSLGKGLSAATLDKDYQDRRRMNMVRNKPKHAISGVTQGATSFATSLASGVTGLVTRPLEGAEREGFGGFLKGVGKGVVGVVTKPVVGVFDLASNVTEGIRNTTTVFDNNEVDRVRLPRYIGRDGILYKYSQREALGQSWLKEIENGKYFYDDYIAHCSVQSDEVVAILTYNRIMLVRTKKLTVDWDESFYDIQTIKCESTGIAIYLRPGVNGPFLPIAEKSSRDWFFKKIEEAVTNYNADKRPVD